MPGLLREVLERFGETRIRAWGGSMLPAFEPGDVLHIRRRETAAIGAGDVVVFEREARIFAHRVIRIDGGRIVTRGDAHYRNDPPVEASQVLGVVTAVTRDGHTRTCPAPGLRTRVLSALLTRAS